MEFPGSLTIRLANHILSCEDTYCSPNVRDEFLRGDGFRFRHVGEFLVVVCRVVKRIVLKEIATGESGGGGRNLCPAEAAGTGI